MGHDENLQHPRSEPETIASGLEKVLEILAFPPARWLLVDVARQRLLLILEAAAVRSWPISTAAAGIDGRQDSGGTPPGVHRIGRKIGDGQPPGAVFVSRRPTGAVWKPDDEPVEEDLILTRILTLEGQEEGINRGPGFDSAARYIYIHGTNDEARLGRPVSHGCVRMGARDVAALFDRVEEGDPVVIL